LFVRKGTTFWGLRHLAIGRTLPLALTGSNGRVPTLNLNPVDTFPSSSTAEDIVRDPGHDPASTQPNHYALDNYLEKHFRQDSFVSFYGCNYG
jgi:hypothetical protein